MKILITGGSGTVGSALKEYLMTEGHEIRILTRKNSDLENQTYHWNYAEEKIDDRVFEELDAIVHLAGTSVADGRWTAKRKSEILNSRVESANFLFRELKKRGQSLKVYITASGTGFYGDRPNEVLNEDSKRGTGFLADVCQQWEDSAQQFSEVGAKLYVNRIGIVLSKTGGFVEKMAGLFKWKIAAELGTGMQKMSWIHIEDLTRIIAAQLSERLLPEIYNATTPDVVTHHKMMRALSNRYQSRIWLPNIPKWALRIILGELQSEITADQEARPIRLTDQNFSFAYPMLEGAIGSI